MTHQDRVACTRCFLTVAAHGIHAGDPGEIADRIACYQADGASLGASFEWRYWYATHGH